MRRDVCRTENENNREALAEPLQTPLAKQGFEVVLLIAAVGILTSLGAQAKPMTGSVTSWEGTFVLQSPHIVIQAEGAAELFLWLYQLDGG